MNPRATYKALLDARLPLYREVATLEIATDDRSVREVAELHRREAGLAPPVIDRAGICDERDAAPDSRPVTVSVAARRRTTSRSAAVCSTT